MSTGADKATIKVSKCTIPSGGDQKLPSERKKRKKVTAILTADFHFRDDTPTCRTDIYQETQTFKLGLLTGLQSKHKCPILNAGDVLNRHRTVPYLEQWLIHHLPTTPLPIITIPGNHDLPNHSLGSYDRSSLAVLEAAGAIRVLKNELLILPGVLAVVGVPYGYGQEIDFSSPLLGREKKVLMLHTLCWKDLSPYPGAPDSAQALRILKKYPEPDLIITGHYHEGFAVSHGNRLLVNPGSMMRMTADQMNYQPKFWLWYAEDNTVEEWIIPIRSDVMSREHIDKQHQRDERIEAFVSRLHEGVEIGLNFEHNVALYINKNKVPQRTKEIIMEVLE